MSAKKVRNMNVRKKDLFNLDGKVAVVTGGLGLLGSSFSKAIRNYGAKVAVLDIREDDGKFNDPFIKTYKTDILDRESLKNSLEKVCDDFGTPEILVNCAAIDFPPSYTASSTGGLLETSELEKSWDKTMEVNVKGMLLCSQVVSGFMAKNKKGSIINIASIYGIVSPDQKIYLKKDAKQRFIKPISYCVSKSAILNMTRYLSTYFAESNIRVNTVTFGGVFNNQDPEFVKNYSSKVPLGRMANKEEYEGVIIFLASDASSYVTGSNLVVDGGYTAW